MRMVIAPSALKFGSLRSTDAGSVTFSIRMAPVFSSPGRSRRSTPSRAAPATRRAASGNWPLLQSYAYHWGIEMKFGPEFHDVFGITNDKQRGRPIDDFWRLLTQEGIDAVLNRENAWQNTTRVKAKEKRNTEAVQASNSPTPAEEAAATVPVITGKKITIPERAKPETKQRGEEEIQRRAEQTKMPVEEIRKAREQEEERRKIRSTISTRPTARSCSRNGSVCRWW